MTDPKTLVSHLVSPYCAKNDDPVSAGKLRQAFVAHTMFFHEAGQQAVQLDRLVVSNISDEESLTALLCESYSRAIFETMFALHFDRMDPHADELLLARIAEMYGDELSARVHRECSTRGVIVTR